MRPHRAGPGTVAAHRARHRGSGGADKVRGAHAAEPAARDILTSGRHAGSFAAVGVGGRVLAAAVTAGRGALALRADADDTPVTVLLPDNGKTKTGRLWTYVRDHRNAGAVLAPALWFAYSPDRKGVPPADASCGVQRCVKGGRVRRVQRALPRGPYNGSCTLGARAA